jgi:1,4-dihydroxy-2-naphthoate octaprenyltransferase
MLVNTLVAAVLIQIFLKFFRKVGLMISRSSLKMGHLRSKTRSQQLKIEKFVNTLVAAVLIQIFWKLVRKVVLMISRSSSKMGYLRSKTRSQD